MLTFENYVLMVKQVQVIAQKYERLEGRIGDRLKDLKEYPIRVKFLKDSSSND